MNNTNKQKSKKTKAFLDSNVLLSFIVGEWKTRHLFDKEVQNKYEFFVSPFVLQEILLVAESVSSRTRSPKRELDKVLSSLKITVLREHAWEQVITDLKSFRNRIVHSNDFLNIQTAVGQCELFVTLDNALLKLEQVQQLRFVSPLEILRKEGLHK